MHRGSENRLQQRELPQYRFIPRSDLVYTAVIAYHVRLIPNLAEARKEGDYIRPPVISTTAPVIYLDSSLNKKATTSATSSPVPILPNATLST